MARQAFLPGGHQVNETGTFQAFLPGAMQLGETQGATPPTPVSTNTQQELRQASANTISGESGLTHSGSMRAMFEAEVTVPAGSTYNEALLLWLNDRNGVTDTNINDAMQRFAAAEGAHNWSSLGAFSAE